MMSYMTRTVVGLLLLLLLAPAAVAQKKSKSPAPISKKEIERLKQAGPDLSAKTRRLEKQRMRIRSSKLRDAITAYRAEKFDDVITLLDYVLP